MKDKVINHLSDLVQWDTSLAAFSGGFISGIWWPSDWLIGGISGIIGCYFYLGVRAQIKELTNDHR